MLFKNQTLTDFELIKTVVGIVDSDEIPDDDKKDIITDLFDEIGFFKANVSPGNTTNAIDFNEVYATLSKYSIKSAPMNFIDAKILNGHSFIKVVLN